MVESLAVSNTSETLPATELDMSSTKPATTITSINNPPIKRIISALIWAFSSINISFPQIYLCCCTGCWFVCAFSYGIYIFTRVEALLGEVGEVDVQCNYGYNDYSSE